MPKSVAETPSDKQIDSYIGSGPFIFKVDEYRPGERVVYVRNTKYVPRNEPAFLPHILKTVANALRRPDEEIAAETTRNAAAFFGLPGQVRLLDAS